MPRAMRAMAERAQKDGSLTIRPLDKKNLTRDLEIIINLFNDAWSENWDFVPMTEAEIDHLGQNLKMLVTGEFVAIAEYEGKPAAMAVTMPNVNAEIADLNGRLLPFGWAKLLWRLKARPPKSVRMPLMGVAKEHQTSPVGAALAICSRQTPLPGRAEVSGLEKLGLAMLHRMDPETAHGMAMRALRAGLTPSPAAGSTLLR